MVRTQALQTVTELLEWRLMLQLQKWCIFDKSNAFHYIHAFFHSMDVFSIVDYKRLRNRSPTGHICWMILSILNLEKPHSKAKDTNVSNIF